MPTCKEMTELLSDAIETPQPWPKRCAMQLHLLVCKTCRRYNRQIQLIQQAFHKIDERGRIFSLSEEAKKRIKAKLTQNQE